MENDIIMIFINQINNNNKFIELITAVWIGICFIITWCQVPFHCVVHKVIVYCALLTINEWNWQMETDVCVYFDNSHRHNETNITLLGV